MSEQQPSVRKTLCSYEHPAARHDIDTWRQGMEDQGRIHSWLLRVDGSVKVLISPPGAQHVVEMMLIYPLVCHPIRNELAGSEFLTAAQKDKWDKWIHFGKMLLSPDQYREVARRVDNLRQPYRPKQLESEGI